MDAALDQMLYGLADCNIKEELEAEEYFGEGFFDDFEGESICQDLRHSVSALDHISGTDTCRKQ